jgi:hypothetical protein
MGFTKKKSIRRIFKRKQSTKKRGNRTRRHVRSAAIFRRRRTMRGGMYRPPHGYSSSVASIMSRGTGAAAATAASSTSSAPLPKPFLNERLRAATGGSGGYRPPLPIKQDIRGAIIIVRDTSTGHILLGIEGVHAFEGGGAKRYGENPTQDESLQNREKITADVYQRIIGDQIIQNAAAESARRKGILAAAGGGGGGGVDLLLPLVEKAEREKNMSGNPKYGSHPRIRKDPNNPDHTINFGAPKGGSKEDRFRNIIENHLDTAQREFIEEVGYVFPDNKFIHKGEASVGSTKYAVYLIDVDAAERKLIEQQIATRYARHIGETFDLEFRDPTTVSLNAMTRDALSLI